MRPSALLALPLAVTLVAAAPGVAAGAPGLATVNPALETPPRFDGGDLGNADADDPAVWVHPTDRSRSLVLGTLKDGGLDVYDLAGRLVQHIDAPPAPAPDAPPGRFNNVDVVTGVTFESGSPTGRRLVDLAVVTDRGRDQLRAYAIDPARRRPLVDVTAPGVPFVFSADQAEVGGEATAYGLAVGKVGSTPLAFVSRAGRATVAGLVLVVREGRVTYRSLRRWRFPTSFVLPDGSSWTPCLDEDGVEPQFEGMVFDPRTRTLYAAQEPVGIWALSLHAPARLVERVREYGVPYDRTGPDDEDEYACEVHHQRAPAVAGRHLASDAEGLTIYPTGQRDGVLLASSQGDSTFHAFDLRTFAHRGGFEVGGAAGVDRVDESDGAHVVPQGLGPAFPGGLLVVHDGENDPPVVDDEGETVDQTNFKYVSWPAVAAPLGLPGGRR